MLAGCAVRLGLNSSGNDLRDKVAKYQNCLAEARLESYLHSLFFHATLEDNAHSRILRARGWAHGRSAWGRLVDIQKPSLLPPPPHSLQYKLERLEDSED